MAQHNLNLYRSVAVSCYYSTPNTIALKPVIFAALSTVIAQHPILSAIPMDEDTNSPYFAHLPEIDLEKTVIFSIRDEFDSKKRDQKLDALLESMHNTSFKGNYGKQPFWHVAIIRGPASSKEFIATFVYHHAIGDGVSGAIFHRSFLAALQADLQPLTTTTVFSPKAILLPSMDEIHGLAVNPSPPPKPDTTGLWTGELIKSNPTTHFKSIAIQKITTDRFITV
jgi:Alcohol acetyltransferase